MPIFAYRCESCGFQKDVLQKRADPPLTACPNCGKETFSKQLTAPAFQLKGSGWYVTDFRDNGKGASKPAESTDAVTAPAPSTEAAPASAPAVPAAAAPAPAPSAPAAPAAAPAPSAPSAS